MSADFIAQIAQARADVAELALQHPQLFDAAGRPIVAELRLPVTHQQAKDAS